MGMLPLVRIRAIVCATVFAIFCLECLGQNFVRITDINNPVVTQAGDNAYTGCAWVDYDNDGDQDLFANRNRLYRNDGGGVFVHIESAFGGVSGLGNGCSWADFDNDGDYDVMLCGTPSILYRNDGNDTFTIITEGDIGYDALATNRAWTGAFADWDNDGNVDIILVHPAGFMGVSQYNHMFHNDGPPSYTFTRVTGSDVTFELAPYTVGTWSDFDLDGDVDFFIGCGPAGTQPGEDFIFRNDFAQSGTANLIRITTGEIASTLRDGQVYNWIDADNDRDLDLYITNWGGAIPGGLSNEFYFNVDGEYDRLGAGPIIGDAGTSLGSTWADFDNDGDLDCYVTNDGEAARYYENNGSGTFAARTNAATLTGSHRGATAGDYDNDGDLDLFVNGVGTAKRLFRNDLTTGNGWIDIRPIGTASNRSAIGAKLWAWANISGAMRCQFREVSAQNGFNSHNSQIQHFGLGNATELDSLIIEWPSGERQVFLQVGIRQIVTLEEGNPNSLRETFSEVPSAFLLHQNFPNPFNPTTEIQIEIPEAGMVSLRVVDLSGREVARLVDEVRFAGVYVSRFDASTLPSGVYFCRFKAGGFTQTRKMFLMK